MSEGEQAIPEEPAGNPEEKEDVDVEVAEEKVEPLNPQTALAQVLRNALYAGQLARGLHEAVKALDSRQDPPIKLCVLSNSCNEPAYTKLITALCKEHKIPLLKVEDSKTLGEWCGLCKRNNEGKAVKVVGCSCCVVRDWGQQSSAQAFIMEHIKTRM